MRILLIIIILAFGFSTNSFSFTHDKIIKDLNKAADQLNKDLNKNSNTQAEPKKQSSQTNQKKPSAQIEKKNTTTKETKTLNLSELDLKYCGYPQRNNEIWYFNIKGNSEGKAKMTKFMMNEKVEESDLVIHFNKDLVVMEDISELKTKNIGVIYRILNEPSKFKDEDTLSFEFYKEKDGKKLKTHVDGEGNFTKCAKKNEIAQIEREIEDQKKSKLAQKKQTDYNNSPEGLLHNSYVNYQIISVLYKSRQGYQVVYVNNNQMDDAKKKIKEIETVLVKKHNLNKDDLWNKATSTYKKDHSHFDIVLSTGGYNQNVAGGARLELMKLNSNYQKVTGSGSVKKDF